MPSLHDAVLKTIAYLDLFDFAPTVLDVERWLLQTDESHTVSGIKGILETHPHIQHAEGFYFLKGRDKLVQIRKKKYNWTEQKWKRAHRYLRLLAAMPYVDGIWLVNSMGWENARQSSDIDLLIVVRPGHIWSTRFWTTAVMKLLRQRPHEQSNECAICLSLYISADTLNLQPYRLNEQDIHYAFWTNQCYPLYDNGFYKKFQEQNRWLKNIFSALRWSQTVERREIVLPPIGHMFKRIMQTLCNEWLLKKLQWSIMPYKLRSLANQDQRVVMNDHILKLHTNDTRKERQEEWEQRCRELLAL